MKCTKRQQRAHRRICDVIAQTYIRPLSVVFCLAIVFVLRVSNSYAQANLVLNPSFEDFNQCPTGVDQINRAEHWSAIDSTGTVGPCWPEFNHACSIYGASTVPQSTYFYQFPRTGNGLVQLQVFYDESTMPAPFDLHRDYLQGRLASTLVAGTRYCVSFFVNVTERSHYGINRIGAYLDDGSIDAVNNCGFPQTQFVPQIQYNGPILSDTMNWVKVEGSFVATGTERFITIGNFYSKANTSYSVLPGTNNNNAYGWLLIDDVSVIPMDLPAFAGNDTFMNAGETIRIGTESQQALQVDCKWYVGATLVGTGSYLDISPLVNTTYRLEQTICDSTTIDSVKVDVIPVGINSLENAEVLVLYPNPATNTLTIRSTIQFSKATITDGVGKVLISSEDLLSNNSIDVSELPTGIYHLILESHQGTVRRKFSKL